MANNLLTDTIGAIATAQGRGGVGIIRVSGENARACLSRLFSPYHPEEAFTPRTLVLGKICDTSGEFLDEGLAVYFAAPRSYTGEDVAEFQCHGGPLVEKAILSAVLKTGVRLAEPGEFTLRAFLNGRIDLAQAEAVLDLIEAKTAKGLALAGKQLEGKLSAKIAVLEEQVLALVAELAAAADFPEDVDLLPREDLLARVNEAQKMTAELLAGAGEGRIYREGLSVVLTGAVNVGKSSLLNALLEQDRAIVTALPGTTRDVIEEYLNLDGVPLLVSDTAGLREAKDLAEELGIDKSRAKIAAARVVLLVIDAASGVDREAERLLLELADRPLLAVINKNDLSSEEQALQQIAKINPRQKAVAISAKTGQGLPELKKALVEMALGGNVADEGQLLVSNARHEQALIRAGAALAAAQETLLCGLPADLAAVDLSEAWQALGEISGKTAGQDILDKIFSSFCLGK